MIGFLKNYKFKKMEILDIGCGNGKQIIQAIRYLKKWKDSRHESLKKSIIKLKILS